MESKLVTQALLATTREHARVDIFDYSEMFYNSKRKHGEANNIPPLTYEKLEEFKRKTV